VSELENEEERFRVEATGPVWRSWLDQDVGTIYLACLAC
jgi:hypothetical protein